MRIIHVKNYLPPVLLGYQEMSLAREQARQGHEVYMVTSDRYNPIIYPAAEKLHGDRIRQPGFFTEEEVKIFSLKTLFELPNIIWLLGLERKIKELKPDVVIVHGIANCSAIRVARLKKRFGDFKLIYDDHMAFGLSTSKMRIFYPWFKWIFSPLIQKAADALVAILPETKMFMHERYGIPLERIDVIPLGTDDELFRFDAVARQETRKELALNEDDVVFVYTGKIIPQKQLHLLVEAAANLTANHTNIKVLLVGSGPQSYIEELKQEIKIKNLEGIFVWHDAVPNNQLYRIYSAADVAVWPFGPSISMREAMACNLPVVISEEAAVNELVADDNGFVFREGDVLQLTQHMTKLLDPELRREMGLRSRKLVEDRFNWRTIAQQFIKLV